MAAVHRVPSLKRRDSAPALVGEQRARLSRPIIESLVLMRIDSFTQSRDTAGQIDNSLAQNLGHARMLGIVRSEHVVTFEGLVDLVFFRDLQRAHQLA